MTFRKQAIALSTLTIAALASLTACGGGSDDPAPTTQDVAIDFAPTIGALALDTSNCADVTLAGLTTRGNAAVKAKLTDLRLYVSNVKMVKADGSEVAVSLTDSDWQGSAGTDGVTLLDFENGTCVNGSGTPATNAKVIGKVATGSYTGVKFTLGVPDAMNHVNPTATAIKPLDSTVPGMLWAWQSGRKFIRIEFSPENASTAGSFTGGVQLINADGSQAYVANADGSPSTIPVANTNTFVYHLGSTGCTGDGVATPFSCTTPNTRDIKLAAFNPASQRVAIDLQQLFSGNNGTQNTNGTSAGCMSSPTDPQCSAMFTALDGAMTGTTVFRAMAK
jgi:uncharacterized repeat protein (TIGR04052 family)